MIKKEYKETMDRLEKYNAQFDAYLETSLERLESGNITKEEALDETNTIRGVINFRDRYAVQKIAYEGVKEWDKGYSRAIGDVLIGSGIGLFAGFGIWKILRMKFGK